MKRGLKGIQLKYFLAVVHINLDEKRIERKNSITSLKMRILNSMKRGLKDLGIIGTSGSNTDTDSMKRGLKE